ncbi:unnamed protein product, partial [Pylaiella littoralis]
VDSGVVANADADAAAGAGEDSDDAGGHCENGCLTASGGGRGAIDGVGSNGGGGGAEEAISGHRPLTGSLAVGAEAGAEAEVEAEAEAEAEDLVGLSPEQLIQKVADAAVRAAAAAAVAAARHDGGPQGLWAGHGDASDGGHGRRSDRWHSDGVGGGGDGWKQEEMGAVDTESAEQLSRILLAS